VQGGAIVIPRDGFLDKLHLIYTTGELVVPLTAADATTTANVPDDPMYIHLTSSSVLLLPILRYMIADPGYDDKKLYEYSKKH
jgi:hypothetical protein